MMTFGVMGLTAPFALTALLALPILWWLVRTLPPRPKRTFFPPTALLKGIEEETPTADKTPPWIILLRMTALVLMILALAGPIWRPAAPLTGAGAILIVVDDGFMAAPRWPATLARIDALLARLERGTREVRLVVTARQPKWEERHWGQVYAGDAAALRRALLLRTPRAWPVDHGRLIGNLDKVNLRRLDRIFWFSDGIARTATGRLAATLNAVAPLTIDVPEGRSTLLLAPEFTGSRITVAVIRVPQNTAARRVVRALAADGSVVASEPVRFEAGRGETQVTFDLPAALRNRIRRLDIAGERSAGATYLFDASAARPVIGITGGGEPGSRPPLASGRFYVRRALAPFATLREGSPGDLIAPDLGILTVLEGRRLTERQEREVRAWIRAGGVLIRFAGADLTEKADDLLPVRLRLGGRALGGSLSWETPQQLAPFTDGSPFFGLAIDPEVTISRQILAMPSPDLRARTWARLADGTPLVTARREGDGWIVLVHTTAGPDWSNLALSGLFVDMWQRLLALAAHPLIDPALTSTGIDITPYRLLDAYGALTDPPPRMAPVRTADLVTLPASRAQPPGLYGAPEAPVALNLASPRGPLTSSSGLIPIEAAVDPLFVRAAGADGETSLTPVLLALALLLLLVDFVASLILMGKIRLPASIGGGVFDRARKGTVAGLALVLIITMSLPLFADETDMVDDQLVTEMLRRTRLAYILTGDQHIDDLSALGLKTLSAALARRTAFAPAPPVGIRPGELPLEFFPFVYWPVRQIEPLLNDDQSRDLAHYLATGGVVLFDTGVELSADGLENAGLASLLQSVSIPALERLGPDHVLAKSFYLLDRYPGGRLNATVWVASGTLGNDGRISPLVIGSGDWASAWAVDPVTGPITRVLEGGERQRELAYRFGINVVMYALTGTYKADQLHIDALMDRMGAQ